MDRHGKRLPPWATELGFDLARGSISEPADGTPLGVIVANIDSSEVWKGLDVVMEQSK